MSINSRILLISDSQGPYQHPDIIDFLSAAAEWVQPSRVIHMGDEVDQHALSRFPKDPDLWGTRREHELAEQHLDDLERLFPTLELLDSNHSQRPVKKALEAGLPRRWVRSYGEVWNKPNWVWYDKLRVELPDKRILMLEHGEAGSASQMAKTTGFCFAQGHRHQEFYIDHINNGYQTIWGLQTGCLIDIKSYAFKYGIHSRRRPILGTAAIIDGNPMLIPLLEKRPGKWSGKLV